MLWIFCRLFCFSLSGLSCPDMYCPSWECPPECLDHVISRVEIHQKKQMIIIKPYRQKRRSNADLWICLPKMRASLRRSAAFGRGWFSTELSPLQRTEAWKNDFRFFRLRCWFPFPFKRRKRLQQWFWLRYLKCEPCVHSLSLIFIFKMPNLRKASLTTCLSCLCSSNRKGVQWNWSKMV